MRVRELNGSSEIKLIRANICDAERIWKMQICAFADQYEKYQDHETNPANEPLDRVQDRLNQPDTYYYIIEADHQDVGAIRVIDPKNGKPKRISPLFVLPDFLRQGIASAAVKAAEKLHGSDHWTLSAVLQEEENCRFYEKIGYKRTGLTQILNERLTLVFYQK